MHLLSVLKKLKVALQHLSNWAEIVFQGNLLGTVVGKPIANVNAPAFNDDGGYGSIPFVLLQVRCSWL